MAPFLSNLNVLSNIMLVQEIKEYWFKNKAKDVAMEKLKIMNLSHKALAHHTTLTKKDIFYTQLIRASMANDKNIVLDRPFDFVPFEHDIGFIIQAAQKLDIDHNTLRIIDLMAIKNRYKEEQCRIEEW